VSVKKPMKDAVELRDVSDT